MVYGAATLGVHPDAVAWREVSIPYDVVDDVRIQSPRWRPKGEIIVIEPNRPVTLITLYACVGVSWEREGHGEHVAQKVLRRAVFQRIADGGPGDTMRLVR